MRFLSWVLGFAVGVGLGWATGRLYAPQAGLDTRRQLERRYRWIAAEADKAAKETRAELEARYQAARGSAAAPA